MRPVRRPLLALTAATAALLTVATACGGSGADDANGGGDEEVTLTVLAAASLTDVFTAAQELYAEEHPEVTLEFSFAGSQELVAQVEQGAPADALVTADTATMDGVADLTAAEPVVIARNALTIVTPPDNPAGVDSLDDLADPGLRLVLAAPEVPAGRYGRQILDAQGIDAAPDSEEANVRAVLGKVRLGEADAGLVYVTDATSAGDDVATVAIPEDRNVTAEYPAAALADAEHPAEAAEFVEWLGSDEARALLGDAGFQAP
ncbi:molybdate ABC transporter substrate-binding protein [Streptomyces sp. NPDC127098]|uniref:molybdate ABC transporter substrate-binding protein n=1 Tax=Streptomyces sp. NPDC127098 TaxID=3347137 RepID=UPI0036620AA1